MDQTNATNADNEPEPVRWPGAIMLIYSFTCIFPYTLCLIVIRHKSTAKLPSYQIIFHIGITDLTQLWLNGVVGGVFSLCQNDFNHTLNKIIGGVMDASSLVCLLLADLLAWNRLFQFYNPVLAKKLFSSRNTRVFLVVAWLYGFAWMVAYMCPDMDVVYTPSVHSWDYAPTPKSQRFAFAEFINDSVHSASMVFCYACVALKAIIQVGVITSPYH